MFWLFQLFVVVTATKFFSKWKVYTFCQSLYSRKYQQYLSMYINGTWYFIETFRSRNFPQNVSAIAYTPSDFAAYIKLVRNLVQ